VCTSTDKLWTCDQLPGVTHVVPRPIGGFVDSDYDPIHIVLEHGLHVQSSIMQLILASGFGPLTKSSRPNQLTWHSLRGSGFVHDMYQFGNAKPPQIQTLCEESGVNRC
jgi:hypothetical protein